MPYPESHENDPVSDRVDAFLAEFGISRPSRPDARVPTLSRNVSELSDEELVDLMGQTNGWLEHLDFVLGEAEIATARRTSAADLTEARAIRNSRETSMKGKERMAELDEGHLMARRQERHAYETEVLLKARIKGLERQLGTLSRELTRRTSPAGIMRGSALRGVA